MANESRKLIWFYLNILFTLLVIFAGMIAASPANALIYYISPTGSDSNSGTSSTSPWKTFGFAVPRLKPGDTLNLKNGTYNGSNSGFPVINCRSNASNGTSLQPITIKAENERQAFLDGDGFNTFTMRNCSHWIVEGLRVKSADNSSATWQGVPVWIDASNNITLRRLLVYNNNRYTNTSGIGLHGSPSNLLIEENELYSFHRNGIAGGNITNSILRRNYVNSRGHADITGGFASNPTNVGDSGISIYPGSGNIIENNISEGNGGGFDIQAQYGLATKNKFLGNISINDIFGVFSQARGIGIHLMPVDNTFVNQIVINSRRVGINLRANKNTQCINCSVIGANTSGLSADRTRNHYGDGAPSVFVYNSLVTGVNGTGFYISEQSSWGIKSSHAYNNSVDFRPSLPNANIAVDPLKIAVDPQLGNCRVYIPDSSPMKQLGIGANVLYRYQNGVLTNQPLWDPVTGEFPHGAIVPGVNDIAGASAFDVHKRLNVNINGCHLPPGYASGATSSSSGTGSTVEKPPAP